MALRVGTTFVVAMAVATGLSAQAPRPPESVLSKLLRIAGLTAAPSQMRGPADDAAVGDIWTVNVDGRSARALTSDGGYRSPIFNGSDVLAIRGNAIVRPGVQRSAVVVQGVPGMIKLVGIDAANPGEVVVLLDPPAAGSPLAVVSLQGGKLTPLPYDASSDQQRRLLAQIRAQDRTYGETTIYTKTETKPGLSRPIEWTDVFVRRGSEPPRNVSVCDGANCVQPALSPDGRSVAFVKVED